MLRVKSKICDEPFYKIFNNLQINRTVHVYEVEQLRFMSVHSITRSDLRYTIIFLKKKTQKFGDIKFKKKLMSRWQNMTHTFTIFYVASILKNIYFFFDVLRKCQQFSQQTFFAGKDFVLTKSI